MCSTAVYVGLFLFSQTIHIAYGGGYEPDLGLPPDELDLSPKDYQENKDHHDKPATSFQSFYLESKDPVPIKVPKSKKLEFPKSPITFTSDSNGGYKQQTVEVPLQSEGGTTFGGYSSDGYGFHHSTTDGHSSDAYQSGNNAGGYQPQNAHFLPDGDSGTKNANAASQQDFTIVHEVQRNHNGYGGNSEPKPQPNFSHNEANSHSGSYEPGNSHSFEGNQVGYNGPAPSANVEGYTQKDYNEGQQNYYSGNQNGPAEQSNLGAYDVSGHNFGSSNTYTQQDPQESQIEYFGEGYTYEIHNVPHGHH